MLRRYAAPTYFTFDSFVDGDLTITPVLGFEPLEGDTFFMTGEDGDFSGTLGVPLFLDPEWIAELSSVVGETSESPTAIEIRRVVADPGERQPPPTADQAFTGVAVVFVSAQPSPAPYAVEGDITLDSAVIENVDVTDLRVGQVLVSVGGVALAEPLLIKSIVGSTVTLSNTLTSTTEFGADLVFREPQEPRLEITISSNGRYTPVVGDLIKWVGNTPPGQDVPHAFAATLRVVSVSGNGPYDLVLAFVPVLTFSAASGTEPGGTSGGTAAQGAVMLLDGVPYAPTMPASGTPVEFTLEAFLAVLGVASLSVLETSFISASEVVSVAIQPVAFTGESSQVIKSWAEGAVEWLRGPVAPEGVAAYSLTFSSELNGEETVDQATAGPTDLRAFAGRFVVPRNHARTLRLSILITLESAGQAWAWEGMRVGFNTQSTRTRSRKSA